MCMAPKIPALPPPAPPPPPAPIFEAKGLGEKAGIKSGQKKAAKQGVNQLRIPLNSVNSPT